jgi:uncharacterized damage-inducible protein DinB
MPSERPEPWLRGTHAETPAVLRGVVHALELAGEDLDKWCSALSDVQLNLQAGGSASVAFHLRHISRSLDRLLTYAEGHQLSDVQFAAMKTEAEPGARLQDCLAELHSALVRSITRVLAFSGSDLDASRPVGRKSLPTSVAGLLVHVADHTMRHVGQAITTAKFVASIPERKP